MPYLMVCIDKPDAEKHSLVLESWRKAVREVDTHMDRESEVEKPTENVWLIPLPNGVDFLRTLLVGLDQQGPKCFLLNAPPEACVWKAGATLLSEKPSAARF